MDFIKRITSEFFYLDLRSLALLRVCTGFLIIADLIDRGRDITAFYTDFGFLPRSHMLENFPGSWSISLHNLTGSYEGQLLLFFIAGIFALMLIVGYRTTLATVVSWLMLVSLDSRNYLVVFGADQVFRLILFWGMFLPWHARFSIDAALSKKVILPVKFASAATFAYIVQVIIIYLFSVIHKSGPAWRTEGTAVYFSLALHSFRTPFFGEMLFNLPFLHKPLTFAVFIQEAIGPFLIFIPYRKDFFRFIIVLSFILLHSGLGLGLRLGIFSWACIILWIALLPWGFWNLTLRFLKNHKRTNLTIYYDNSCGFCYKAVKILKTLFLLPQTSISGTENDPKMTKEMHTHNSWVVIDNTKKHHYKYDGFLAIASASPLLSIFSPIASLPLIKKFGEFIYKKVSSHRKSFCSIDTRERSFNSKLSYKIWSINLLVIFFLVYVLIWNLNTLSPFKNSMPEKLRPLGIVLGINQKWALFAPEPSKRSGWFVIAARLKNGSYYDIYNNTSSITFDKPIDVTSTYRSARWQRFLINITTQRNYKYATYYIQYLCRDWNKNHSEEKQAEEISIGYIYQDTELNYSYNSGRSVIAREVCSNPESDQDINLNNSDIILD